MKQNSISWSTDSKGFVDGNHRIHGWYIYLHLPQKSTYFLFEYIIDVYRCMVCDTVFQNNPMQNFLSQQQNVELVNDGECFCIHWMQLDPFPQYNSLIPSEFLGPKITSHSTMFAIIFNEECHGVQGYRAGAVFFWALQTLGCFTHRIESAKCSEAGGSFSVCLWWVFWGEVKAESGWF